MKKITKQTLLFAMAMFAAVQFSVAKDGQGIQFFKGTWEEALKEATKTNKLLFVDAFATWCGPCKMMDKKVFVQKEVGDFYNKNFIPVKIDVDSKIGRPLATKYQVKAMPTYLFVAGNGKLVYRKLGYMQPKAFISVGKSAMKFPQMIKQYNSGDRSKKFLNEYLAVVDDADAKVANKYLAGLSEKEMLYDENNFKIMSNYVRNPDSKAFQFFLAHTKEYQKEYGNQALNLAVGILDGLYAKAFAQGEHKGGKKDAQALQKLFNTLMKLDPIMPKNKAEGIVKKLQKQFDDVK
ncbi:MAG TPA: hypothetical protein DCS93_05820 [Microscillaceae bacterium]|nr:hypothetical protein [Microscillaceae bacterium]